jgi:threonine/homoserine/homoserine lactone efflux protein
MEFFLLASAHGLALLSPGPDFLLIVRAALCLSLRQAVRVCVGIALGNGIYILVAVFGLEMLRSTGLLNTLLRLCGGAYLLYIGVSLLRAPRQSLGQEVEPWSGTANGRDQLLIGLLSALLNPKNMIFYLSLFTAMVAPTTPLGIRLLYGAWMVGVVLIWDLALAMFLGRGWLRERLGRFVYVIEKGAGLGLALFGLLMVLD